MSYRFDNRTEEKFKKQIKFSTMLEAYFFNRWMQVCDKLDHVFPDNPRDNGVDNSGEFIAKGATSGADYMVDLKYNDMHINDMPLEVKWVPTHGKLTLKEGDLKAYIRESAGILFIYNSKRHGVDLRMPKDFNFDKHIEKLESIEDQFKWAIMFPENVENLLKTFTRQGRMKPIYYMGNKPGLVLNQSEFGDWFTEEPWTIGE